MPTEDGGRPLVIGESPSRAGDKYYMCPLSGNPARFLCEMSGIEIEGGEAAYWALVRNFDTANSLRRFPKDGWNAEAARERVSKLVQDYDVVVLMGKKAQAAYPTVGVAKAPFFVWTEDPFNLGPSGKPRQVVAIPHSSGLNRMNNDPVIRDGTGRVLREALERAKR